MEEEDPLSGGGRPLKNAVLAPEGVNGFQTSFTDGVGRAADAPAPANVPAWPNASVKSG